MTEKSWKNVLGDERKKEYFKNILAFIEKERASGKIIYPQNKDIFNALSFTPFNEVKVVILGQDPYHGPNQAHGLCFSVNHGIAKPPSLKNIFKELSSDLGVTEPNHGNLENWAKQGVLLLNTVLSVQAGNAHSHARIGWEEFTDFIVNALNEQAENLVFMLWGSHAQKKASFVDGSKHCVLKAPHPSPLSAHRGFFGCRHFSKANEYLKSVGKETVNWEIECHSDRLIA